jgi:hypothetical protein
METNIDPGYLIDSLGGTSEVARLTRRTTGAVSQWRDNGIPDDPRIRLAPLAEKKGIISRKEMFPNDWHLIWPELVDQKASADEAA